MNTVIKNILNDDECNSLILLNTEFNISRINNPYTKTVEINKNFRNTLESYITLPVWFHIKIKNWIKEEGYELVSPITHYTFLKYTKGSYFREHRDDAPEGGANKKITLIIELSKSSDYSGGEFVIEGENIIRDKGDGILFDSHKLHELKEVTDGTRLSFVCWILNTQLSTYKKSLL
jgi:hypothetical protein